MNTGETKLLAYTDSDLARDEVIELVHCSIQDQVVDIMKKPLKNEAFQKLRRLLGIRMIQN